MSSLRHLCSRPDKTTRSLHKNDGITGEVSMDFRMIPIDMLIVLQSFLLNPL